MKPVEVTKISIPIAITEQATQTEVQERFSGEVNGKMAELVAVLARGGRVFHTHRELHGTVFYCVFHTVEPGNNTPLEARVLLLVDYLKRQTRGMFTSLVYVGLIQDVLKFVREPDAEA